MIPLDTVEALNLSRVTYQQPDLADRHFFMCRHSGRPGRALEDVAASHDLDLQFQAKHGLRWLTYFLNADSGNSFCLAEAPSRAAVEACHLEAHGEMLPYRILEVDWNLVQSFLGEIAEPGMGQIWNATPVRTILVAELSNAAALASELGDLKSFEITACFEDKVLSRIKESHGTVVHSSVSLIVASFGSPAAAVACAVEIRTAFLETREEPLTEFRIGLNSGEPVTQNGELFGVAVNLAREVCSGSAAGAILATRVVRDLCLGKPFNFSAIPSREMPLFGTVELYEVTAADTVNTQALKTHSQAGLSSREVEVLRLLAKGKSNGQIANELVISANTVARHVAHILVKTNSDNRTEAVAFAFRERLL